ncbi:uncharacterized protein LOC115627591 [Scaptodrosophila lebanonensis]|uniref:Uncharacterized protein LOC115627591 n=1 Tax=Drosophila lebanonensis TaxID=7225 RepID=A0A6J2TSY2_DROLE|nr:uncharacterized protein LOC115627591 [Scaptodrosophila lebanonensis]
MSKRPRELDSVKKKAARARFRKLVRSVLFNRQWLTDTDEQHTVSLNAKRNVATLFRRKRKAGILTMAEKALLGTASYTRTVEERKKLVSIVAHLACFSKIPPKIRARMVPCLRFMACGAGRRLMKEGDRGVTIYFIVTGEVEMTKKVFNAVTNAYEDKTEAIYGPGDCVGDVDMLEQQLRTHSFTSTSACELLLLNDRDFHEILGPYAVKIWREKKRALAGLEYFSFMSRNQARHLILILVH